MGVVGAGFGVVGAGVGVVGARVGVVGAAAGEAAGTRRLVGGLDPRREPPAIWTVTMAAATLARIPPITIPAIRGDEVDVRGGAAGCAAVFSS